MSSTASNYDVSKLVTGQALAAIALFLGLLAAWGSIAASLKNSAPFLGSALLYGIMMFASSYVEEEQHFWYWTTTGWFGLLWIKWYAVFLSLEFFETHSALGLASTLLVYWPWSPSS